MEFEGNFTWTEDHFTVHEENTTLDDSYGIPEIYPVSSGLEGEEQTGETIQ